MSEPSLIWPVPFEKTVPHVSGYAHIAGGFANIAALLGRAPETCLFMNSLVVDRTDQTDRKVAATDGLDMRANQYVLALSGRGSLAAHLALTPAHHSYTNQYLADGKLLSVPKAKEGRLFPGGSLIASLQKAIDQEQKSGVHADTGLLNLLHGKTLANSYCLSDAQKLASRIEGDVLNAPDSYLRFLDKSFVHDSKAEYDIPVTPGLVVRDAAEIDEAYAQMRKLVRREGLDATRTKCWIKAGSLSGGQGIIPIAALTPENWNAAFTKIAQAYHDSGFFRDGATKPTRASFGGCDYFMPVIVEIDAGHLPSVDQITMNACVQAVVGPSGVSFVGTTLQHTQDGEYIGSVMPKASQIAEIKTAQISAQKLLGALWHEGYTGFAGVDVLVAQTKDRGLKGYVLEVNPRLNSSTPLLRLVQHAAIESGQPRTGNSANYLLPPCQDPLRLLEKTIGPAALYRRGATGFKGFVPVMIDQPPDRPTLVKGIIIGDTAAATAQTQKQIYAKLASAFPNLKG